MMQLSKILKAQPLLLAFIFQANLFAQNTSVTVKAGSTIMDVLSPSDLFLYPQFINGNVFFRDGINAQARMNYNRLLDEIHFIDPKGDTLALANEKMIKFISIDQDSFFYEQGYVRRILGNSVAKLAVKHVWKVADRKKTGAYNMTSSVSSIASHNTYYDGRRFHKITVKEDVVLSKVERYYFGDKYNHFVVAGKKNLLMLFPKEQRRIELYLRENKVDFDNKDDLEKVVQFLEHL